MYEEIIMLLIVGGHNTVTRLISILSYPHKGKEVLMAQSILVIVLSDNVRHGQYFTQH